MFVLLLQGRFFSTGNEGEGEGDDVEYEDDDDDEEWEYDEHAVSASTAHDTHNT